MVVITNQWAVTLFFCTTSKVMINWKMSVLMQWNIEHKSKNKLNSEWHGPEIKVTSYHGDPKIKWSIWHWNTEIIAFYKRHQRYNLSCATVGLTRCDFGKFYFLFNKTLILGQYVEVIEKLTILCQNAVFSNQKKLYCHSFVAFVIVW